MSLSEQKLNFEKEIAELTKKFTSMMKEVDDKNFVKQQELSSENAMLTQKDLENTKKLEILTNE